MKDIQELIVEIASELIKVPGHNEVAEYEYNTALKLAEILRINGVDCETPEADSGRLNVVAKINGGGGPSLLLTTHLDTIPPGTIQDAYQPMVCDGRLYGRGAVDVKGVLASMAAVMIHLKRHSITPPGDVIFAGVAGEESGSVGMRALIASDELKPDLAVIGEPTELEVAVAHNGILWMEIEFFGKATHGSRPENGINAVYKANDFLCLLREELLPKLAERRHPLTGSSTLNVGVIEGGTRPTVVPANCLVQFDRRFIPGETRESALEELNELLEKLSKNDPDFKHEMRILLGDVGMSLPPLEAKSDDPMIKAVCEITADVLKKQVVPKGMPCWTDAALANAVWKVPSVIIGPGDVAQAHADDEYVELTQLYDSYKLYLELALSIGKGEKAAYETL